MHAYYVLYTCLVYAYPYVAKVFYVCLGILASYILSFTMIMVSSLYCYMAISLPIVYYGYL